MKTTLPYFYFVFLVLTICLFSFEERPNVKTPKVMNAKEDSKDSKTGKKSFKHHYRFSNLC